MSWKDQSGVTLIELLVALAILSIIIIPILTFTFQSSTRTAVQGKESQLIYFAQEIIEEIKAQRRTATNETGNCTMDDGCHPSISGAEATASYTIRVTSHPTSPQLNEITVLITSSNVVAKSVELITVIKR